MFDVTSGFVNKILKSHLKQFIRRSYVNVHLYDKKASTWMWQSPKPKKGQPQSQKFEYLLVLDFEATCGPQGYAPKPQEIIEFPCALLNVKKGFQIEAIFHEYVRPIHNPKLTTFCTELTGITQVSNGIELAVKHLER